MDDLNNNEIISAKYDDLQYARLNTFIVAKDSLYGLIDKDDNELIPAKYHKIEYRSDNSDILWVTNEKGLQALFNHKGETIYPFKIKELLEYWFDYKTRTEYFCTKELFYTITEKDNVNNPEQFYKNIVLKIKGNNVEKLKINGNVFKFLNDTFLVYGFNWRRVGFYNLHNDKNLSSEFDEYIYDKHNNQIIAKKGDYFDTLIDSLSNVTTLEHPILKTENGYYFYTEDNNTGVMNKSLKTANFKYPVLKVLEDVDHTYASHVYAEKARPYFQFNPNINSKKNGLIHFDGTIIIQPENYDTVGLFYFEKNNTGYCHYPDTGHSTKYPNPHLKKYDNVFFGTNTQSDSRIVNLITSENGKIAEFEIKKNEWWNFSSYNNAVIIRAKDSVKLYDLISKKINLKVAANTFNEDGDSGYTVSNYNAKSLQTKYEKYDSYGKFIMDTIIESKNRYYGSFDENYIQIKNNKYGTVNSKGKLGIPFIYDYLQSKNAKLFIARKNDLYGVINAENQVVMNIKYQDVKWISSKKEYSNEMVVSGYMVKEKNKWGFADQNLKLLLPTEFDTIQLQKMAIVAKKDSLLNVYDANGKLSFKTVADSMQTKPYNRYHFYKKGKEIYVDKNGSVIEKDPNMSWDDKIKLEYSKKIGDKFYLTKNDSIIYKTPINNVEVVDVSENFMGETIECVLIKDENNLFGLYTKDLKQILPFYYNEILLVKNMDLIIVNKHNKFGVVNLKNKIVVPLKYDKIEYDYRGFFKCTIGTNSHNITPQNKIIYLENPNK